MSSTPTADAKLLTCNKTKDYEYFNLTSHYLILITPLINYIVVDGLSKPFFCSKGENGSPSRILMMES